MDGFAPRVFPMTHNEVLGGVYDSGAETETPMLRIIRTYSPWAPIIPYGHNAGFGRLEHILVRYLDFRGCMVHKGKLCGMAAAALRMVRYTLIDDHQAGC